MVLKADQQRVKALLTETITLLCKNGLHFRTQFTIEGLIGITLDQDEIFLVNINETIKSVGDSNAASGSANQSFEQLPPPPTKRQRVRVETETNAPSPFSSESRNIPPAKVMPPRHVDSVKTKVEETTTFSLPTTASTGDDIA